MSVVVVMPTLEPRRDAYLMEHTMAKRITKSSKITA